MRVVAGSLRGRRLVAPPGDRVRPTSDRVREAVFNALGSLGAIEDADVLDLFAGSGALGIEALSRGAAHATFVERDPVARRALESNIESTALGDRATVVRGEALAYLSCDPASPDAFPRDATSPDPAPRDRADPTRASSAGGGRRWDLALLDPPYAFDAWDELLRRLPADLAVIESGAVVTPPSGWSVVREKAYGTSVVTIARRTEPVRPAESAPTI